MKFSLLIYSLIIITSCSGSSANDSTDLKIKKIEEDSRNQIGQLNSRLDEMKKKNSDLRKSYDSLLKVKTTANTSDTSEIENMIKSHTDISDSIKVIGVKVYGSDEFEHVYAFIDFNAKSKFHYSISGGYDFSAEWDRKQYESIYESKLEKMDVKISLNEKLLSQIKGNWKPIYKYKGDFYNYYSHCDFYNKGFTISDSTLIHYYMDGLAPYIITNIEETSDHFKISTSQGSYSLKSIDSANEIYLYNDNGSKMYVIPESNINRFPIVVEDCHETGGEIVEFDKVNE